MKTCILIVGGLTLSAFNFVLAQPANNNFANRISLAAGNVSAHGSNLEATQEDGEMSRTWGAAASIWWSWTATNTGLVTVTVHGGPVPISSWFDGFNSLVLAVVTGDSLPQLTEVASREDHWLCDGQFAAQVSFQSTLGTTYQLLVDSFPPLETITLRIAQTAPPAVVIKRPPTDTVYVSGQPIGLMAEAFDPDGRIDRVDFLADLNEEEIYGFSLPWYERIGTASQWPFAAVWSNAQPSQFSVIAQATDGSGAEARSMPVVVNVRPANDDFANRQDLPSLPVSISLLPLRATLEAGEPVHPHVGGSVWFTWTALADGSFTLNTTAGLDIYTGATLPDLILVTNNSSEAEWGTRRIVLAAQAGTAYQMALVSPHDYYTLDLRASAPPSVFLSAPTNNSRFFSGSLITIRAETQDDRSVRQVEFYGGYDVLGVVTNPPYVMAFEVSEQYAREITLTARAMDNDGLITISDPVSVFLVPAPPANDLFSNAVPITGDFLTFTNSNRYATKDPGEPAYGDNSIWYSWTAPSTGPCTITARGEQGLQAIVGIYTGSVVSDLTLIVGNTPSSSPYSQAVFQADAGARYHIALTTVGTPGGPIRVSLLRNLPPTVTVTHPTNSSQFMSGSPMVVTAEANDPDGAIRQVDFWLLSPTIGLGYQVVATVTNPPYTTSLMVGGTSYVRASATDHSGLTSFSDPVSFTVTPVAPLNDNFSDRIAISGCPVSFTGANSSATVEFYEPLAYVYVWDHSVWWSWTSPVAGPCTISGVGQGFAPALSVFTGSSLATLSHVASTHSEVMPWTTRLSFQAEAGVTYQIAVSSYYDRLTGPFTLSIIDSLPPTVSLTSPTNNSRFTQGATVLLTAEAADPDGQVRQVEFFLQGQSIATLIQAPFEVAAALPEALAGFVGLSAVATDDSGLVSASTEIAFEIVAPQPQPPPNDSFARRVPIAGWLTTAQGTGRGATREPGEPAPFGYPDRGSVWWSWKAPGSGTATIRASDKSVGVAVYEGSALESLDLVAKNSPLGDGSLVFTAQSAVAYQMALEPLSDVFSWTLFLDTPQPNRITDAGVNDMGQFCLRFETLSSRGWVLENSADLITWTSIITNLSGQNVIQFVDPALSSSRSGCFYRVNAVP